MKQQRTFILLATVLLSSMLATTLSAQSRILSVLESQPSVRATGMGYTALGLSSEMHLYTNPGALLFQDTDNAFNIGTSGELFPKTDVGRLAQFNLASSYKLSERRAVLLGVRYQGGLVIPTYDEGKSATNGSIKPYDWVLDLGYTFLVTPSIAVFGQASYFVTAPYTKASGVAFGIGVGYHTEFQTGATVGKMTLGARLQDAGTAVRFDQKGLRQPLPTSVELGGDYIQELATDHRLTFALSGRYFTPKDAQLFLLGTGLEYQYKEMLAVRVGYRGGQKEMERFTVGAGAKYAGIQLNAAYSMSLRPETSPNIISLSLGFDF